MKTLIAVLMLTALFIFPVEAGSRIDLTSPDQVQLGTPTYAVASIEFRFNDEYIVIDLAGENDTTRSIIYSADEARAFFQALSAGRPALQKMRFHILQELVANGSLAGVAVE